MSDFIYSKESIEKGILTKGIQAIYHEDKPSVEEFHGDWGSLAVSRNLYNGFDSHETTDHICVVIGGPVLCFRDNEFLKDSGGVEGTYAIYNRWLKSNLKWDEDLSGPFVVLIIDKNSKEVHCITDLMSFIPVYTYQEPTNIMLSTHVDMLARVSGQLDNIDVVSKVDFILHGVVTFPYTVYDAIHQIAPASEHSLISNSLKLKSKAYWLPKEKFSYKSINKAAEELRKSLISYANIITNEVSDVAQFISGGEDSRTLSALLQGFTKDSFIFLDNMNREGKVAKKAADAYDVNFNVATRNKMHYLEILPNCTDLVGDGSQYHHAHTFGFHKSCKLNKYSAVFGGLLSDALLKGSHVKKIRGTIRFPFLPDIKASRYSAGAPLYNSAFTFEVLSELTKRRQAHLKYVKSFRNKSAEEWFELWPSSMNMNIPNLHANRRLFRSYEPFMSKDVVKISAEVPQKWKLNRRLFHKAVKPLLKPTKWVFHSDGRLPYFSWYINSFVQFITWFYRKVGSKTGLIKGNQKSWAEWNVVMNSPEWKEAMDNYLQGINVLSSVLVENDGEKLFEDYYLGRFQRINLLQTLYSNTKSTKLNEM